METRSISLELPVQIHDTDNRFWTPEVQDYCNKFSDRQNHSTNVKADMSHWCIWEETNLFNDFLDWILESIDSHPLAVDLRSWTILSAWLARYKKGQSTQPHTHFPAHLSFVYFLKSSKESSPLNLEGVDIEAKEGRLIIFPALMLHHVAATPAERIVLAGNIGQTPPDLNSVEEKSVKED